MLCIKHTLNKKTFLLKSMKSLAWSLSVTSGVHTVFDIVNSASGCMLRGLTYFLSSTAHKKQVKRECTNKKTDTYFVQWGVGTNFMYDRSVGYMVLADYNPDNFFFIC